jgi:hypothetical protein
VRLIACAAPLDPPADIGRRPSRYRARHIRYGPRRPYGFRAAVAAVAAAAVGAALMIAGPAGARAPQPQQTIDLRKPTVSTGLLDASTLTVPDLGAPE